MTWYAMLGMKWYEAYIGLPLLVAWILFVYVMRRRRHPLFIGRVRTGR
jgi:hypothetical protein